MRCALNAGLPQVKSNVPEHRLVVYRYSFIFSQYSAEAWFWEEVELFRKYLLTSVIIFVQPRTTAQLAAAFLITFAFLIMHVLVVPFAQEAENSTQFWCQISILLVLFSGIIARATSEDAFYRDTGSYNSALIGIVLAASQTGILLIFVFKLRPEGPKPALEIERIAASAITDAIEEQSECLLNEISSQLPEEKAHCL